MLSKRTFYILSLTWGIGLTVIGFIASIFVSALGHKPVANQYGVVFVVGKNWGGLSLGPIMFVSENPSEYVLNHEFGHSIQNCYFGPFMILFSIMSVVRYWYRKAVKIMCPDKKLPPYDGMWLEGMATSIGNKYASK